MLPVPVCFRVVVIVDLYNYSLTLSVVTAITKALKRSASPVPEGVEHPAKQPCLEQSESFDGTIATVPSIDSAGFAEFCTDHCVQQTFVWHPLVKMWSYKKDDGRLALGVKLCPFTGMELSTAKVNAIGCNLFVSAKWPKGLLEDTKELWDDYYKNTLKKEVPENVMRMYRAEKDSMMSIVEYQGADKMAEVVFDLPFEVKPTRSPEYMHCFTGTQSKTKLLCFSLDSIVEPNFEKQKEIAVTESEW